MDLLKRAVAIYHQLTEELAKLPKPAPGLVRVYRGQNKDFGVISHAKVGRLESSLHWTGSLMHLTLRSRHPGKFAYISSLEG
jgi:hypothetical protein